MTSPRYRPPSDAPRGHVRFPSKKVRFPYWGSESFADLKRPRPKRRFRYELDDADQPQPDAEQSLVRHALAYAARGWQVFPAHSSGEKKSHKKAEYSDGRNWGKTTDPDEIRRDFQTWPKANIGVATGPDSGIFVVELDTKEGHSVDGIASMRDLEAKHGQLPDTLTGGSPSGSLHFYFNCPADVTIRNSASKIAPGIDVRGDGGMVLAPPSVKPGRGTYEWLNTNEIADAPDWLIELITADDRDRPQQTEGATFNAIGGKRQQVYAGAALERGARELASTSPSKRNDKLNKIAFGLGRMVARGWISRAEVESRLFAAATTCGLVKDDGERAVYASLKSGLDAGLRSPHPDLTDRPERTERPEQPRQEQSSGSAYFNAKELDGMRFEPLKYVVPDILVEGVTVLAGKPKIGKSWLLLHAAIAVASGGNTLGLVDPCTQGDVLYCALEDNKRRLQGRMRKLGRETPEPLDFRLEIPRLVEGGLKEIADWIKQAEQPRLVIIDTLAMVRVSKKREESNYEADYNSVVGLRTLAAEHGVAIVLNHHMRKLDADDPFDTVSGTLGLTGAVDTTLILKRESNGGVALYGHGRDLPELEKALAFDRANCTWTIIGEVADVRASEQRRKILAAMREIELPATLQEIATEAGMKRDNTRKILGRMDKEGWVNKAGRGKYNIAPQKQF